MMKPLLAFAVLVVAVFPLVACGGMPGPAPWSDSAANRLEASLS